MEQSHNTEQECPICFDHMESNSKTMPYECKHEMHKSCESTWTLTCLQTTTDPSCPVCRSPKKPVLAVLLSTSTFDKTVVITSAESVILSWTAERHTNLIMDIVSLLPYTHIRNKCIVLKNISSGNYLPIIVKFFKSSMVTATRYSLSSSTSHLIQGSCRPGSFQFQSLVHTLVACIKNYNTLDEFQTRFHNIIHNIHQTRSDMIVMVSGLHRTSLSELCHEITL